VVAVAQEGPRAGARGGGFFEEALEEARQRARDLVAGVDREALAGPSVLPVRNGPTNVTSPRLFAVTIAR
jgi:hypothetical protein